jgi:hypothetical protein
MSKFLNKFFPPSKASKLRENITSFAQLDNETIYEAWEQYKEALRKCPNHGIPDWLEIDMFYKGLLPTTRTLIDAASGGALNRKTKDEAYELLDEMASNSYQWPNDRDKPRKTVGVLELDAITALQAQVSLLTKKLEEVNVIQAPNSACNWCGGDHPSEACQGPATTEQVNAMGNNFQNPQLNPYSNTYNPGWKQHPNFSWGGKQPQQQFQQQNFQPQQTPQQQQYQQPQQTNAYQIPQKREPSTNNLLQALITSNVESNKANAENNKTTQQMLGQLIKQLNERPLGSLPSDTEKNPKEQVKAITLRSGRELEAPENTSDGDRHSTAPSEIAEEGTQNFSPTGDDQTAISPPGQ